MSLSHQFYIDLFFDLLANKKLNIKIKHLAFMRSTAYIFQKFLCQLFKLSRSPYLELLPQSTYK